MHYVIAKSLPMSGTIVLPGGSGVGTTPYGRGTVIEDSNVDTLRYWCTKLEAAGHAATILDADGHECELVEREVQRVVNETKLVVVPVAAKRGRKEKEAE